MTDPGRGPFPPPPAEKIEQAGEAVGRIDPAFDDVEGEKIEAAKAPDRDGEQQDRPPVRIAGDEEGRGQNADDVEKPPPSRESPGCWSGRRFGREEPRPGF